MGTLSRTNSTVIGRDIGSNGYVTLSNKASDAKKYLVQVKSDSDKYKTLLAEIDKFWIGDDADEFKGLLLNISKLAEEGYQLAQNAEKTLAADKAAYDTLQNQNKATIK